ncbi:hypothetical protein TYRP_021061 [Tyrophagus putrescentiae]|nr:hypothetical protein TYRP_021061 [Tyrophagus putrescentiae]
MHQSSDSSNSAPNPQPRFQLPMHSKFHYSAVLGSSCLALVSCFRSIKEGRKENLLQSAKALLLCTLLVNTVLLLYALCGGWIVGVLGASSVDGARLVLVGGALLSLLFLAALYYLDSLLLVGVFAVIVSAATAGTATAAVRLQYPPLWLEVVICGLMVVSSLMLLLEYLTEERELRKMKEREEELRRRSSSAASASASSPPMNV